MRSLIEVKQDWILRAERTRGLADAGITVDKRNQVVDVDMEALTILSAIFIPSRAWPRLPFSSV